MDVDSGGEETVEEGASESEDFQDKDFQNPSETVVEAGPSPLNHQRPRVLKTPLDRQNLLTDYNPNPVEQTRRGENPGREIQSTLSAPSVTMGELANTKVWAKGFSTFPRPVQWPEGESSEQIPVCSHRSHDPSSI